MPSAPKRLCRCGGVVSEGVCSRCGPKKRDPYRKSRHERGYDNDWQKLSAIRRKKIPWCIRCWHYGRSRLNESTHHIVKVKDDESLRLDEDNTMPVCTPCHAELDTRYEADRAGYNAEIIEIRRTMKDYEQRYAT